MSRFTVYLTTNLVNGKIYIGKHVCNCKKCKYIGSGDLIEAAKKKYGVKSFKKEILFRFETEEEMNAKEAELVSKEFVKRSDNYNICPGGQGGFGHINAEIWTKEKTTIHNRSIAKTGGKNSRKSYIVSDHHRENLSASLIGRSPSFKGKSHSEETKSKMRKPKNNGTSNSQFGTMWITNGVENRKVKKDVEPIPEGWYKGRK